jgi:hypothetical protein
MPLLSTQGGLKAQRGNHRLKRRCSQHNQDPHRETEAQEDQHQDFEDEIEAVIKDELTHLCQENKCLWLVQEHMDKRRVVIKRPQIMQQQIEQESVTQAELQ